MLALLNLVTLLLRCTAAFFRSHNEQAIVELTMSNIYSACSATILPTTTPTVSTLISEMRPSAARLK